MRGLDTNFKRRTTRVVKGYMEDSKGSPTGHGDSTIKSINHKYNKYTKGYSILDVVQPPYDLTELANFYDTNFANHAAIDAKVENIVGMGYDWKLTSATMQKLEELTGEKLDFTHRKIERLKAQMEDWLEGSKQCFHIHRHNGASVHRHARNR